MTQPRVPVGSIRRVIGHYTFLFLMVVLHLVVYLAVASAVIAWIGPMVAGAVKKGLGAGLLSMLPGLAAWAVLVGVTFYFAYTLGHLLGLFARTYSDRLPFDF